MKKIQFLASFEDYLAIFKRHKRRIAFFSSALAVLAFFYIASRPVAYEVEATFREQGLSSSDKKDGGLTSLMALGSSSDHQSRAITVLKSKNLNKRLIDKLGLQADIVPLSEHGIPLYNTFRNIKAESAILLRRARPGIDDLYRPIRAANIDYPIETSATLYLTVLDKDNFVIDDDEGTSYKGLFGEPFLGKGYSFTLNLLEEPKENRFIINILPKRKVALTLTNKIKIVPDPKDKRVVNLKVIYEDRKLSSEIINRLMALYREWLEEENKKVAEEQIMYLRQREEDENRLLTDMLYKHAIDQSDKMDNSGFASNLLAMDFLTKNLQDYVQKITGINLEVERLSRLNEGSAELFDAFPLQNIPQPINALFTEIRSLKLEVGSLALSIKRRPNESIDESQPALLRQLVDIEEAKETNQKLKSLLADLQSEKSLVVTGNLVQNKRCCLESWIEKMGSLQEKALSSTDTEERWDAKKELVSLKEQFGAYLGNLIQYFQIQEKTLKEGLQNLTETDGNVEGMGLLSSKELLAYYNKELNGSESQIVKNHFILESIKNKELELSSIASMVEDPMGKEMVGRYSKLLLDLQNSSIRSQKEQERIKGDLATQRGHLETHIKESTNILGLKADLLKEAIYTLQTGMLGLYREKIAILEKQASDFINQRIEALLHEKAALYDQIFLIRDELKAMPEKRIQELMIEQKIDLVKKIYTQIVEAIEARNLQSSLEVVQSVPVDKADVPYFPKTPHLLLISLAGGFLGFLLSAGYFISKEGFFGLIASPRNLGEAGLFVAGTLSPKADEKNLSHLQDSDLETLRRLIARLGTNKTALLLEGKGPHYAEMLGSLYGTMGEKTLVISLAFDRAEEHGLLQLLEGKNPSIIHKALYDLLPSGGPARFGTEIMLSKHFKELISSLENKYDRVIAFTPDTASAGSALPKLALFDHLVATVSLERAEEMGSLATFLGPDKITFVFENSCS